MNLICDIPVSKFAFKCNVYRYVEGVLAHGIVTQADAVFAPSTEAAGKPLEITVASRSR